LEGFTNNDEDLRRCLIEKADAVIILSDKFSFNAEHEDTRTILEAMIIKKYLSRLKKAGTLSVREIGTRVCM
jgi:hypothetical protein